MQTKSRISSPHPASAGGLPAASRAMLCSLFSIIHSQSSFDFRTEKTTCLFQTRSPSHSSFSLFLTFSLSFLLLLHSSFAFLCFVPFLAFAFVYPLQQVLWSFFSVHMLLELKVGEWRERRGGQLNPPPEGASASLLPLVHHLSLSLFLSNKQRWPQTVGCITAEQRDIKQKICGQMTNQVRDVTEH